MPVVKEMSELEQELKNLEKKIQNLDKNSKNQNIDYLSPNYNYCIDGLPKGRASNLLQHLEHVRR